MSDIISIIYFVAVAIYILACLFVAYHIVKYYLSASFKIFSLIFFVSVSGILLLINVSLFFMIDWGSFIDKIIDYA